MDNIDRHGYRAEPSDYEMSVVEREPETLLQRYQRLKQEVAELASDVEKVRESQESSEKLLQVSPADLLPDVRSEGEREREKEREREREDAGRLYVQCTVEFNAGQYHILVHTVFHPSRSS